MSERGQSDTHIIVYFVHVFPIPGQTSVHINCLWAAPDIFGLAAPGIGLRGIESPATKQQKLVVMVIICRQSTLELVSHV